MRCLLSCVTTVSTVTLLTCLFVPCQTQSSGSTYYRYRSGGTYTDTSNHLTDPGIIVGIVVGVVGVLVVVGVTALLCKLFCCRHSSCCSCCRRGDTYRESNLVPSGSKTQTNAESAPDDKSSSFTLQDYLSRSSTPDQPDRVDRADIIDRPTTRSSPQSKVFSLGNARKSNDSRKRTKGKDSNVLNGARDSPRPLKYDFDESDTSHDNGGFVSPKDGGRKGIHASYDNGTVVSEDKTGKENDDTTVASKEKKRKGLKSRLSGAIVSSLSPSRREEDRDVKSSGENQDETAASKHSDLYQDYDQEPPHRARRPDIHASHETTGHEVELERRDYNRHDVNVPSNRTDDVEHDVQPREDSRHNTKLPSHSRGGDDENDFTSRDYSRHDLNIRPYPNEDERSDDKPRDNTRHNIDPHSYAPSYDASDVTPRDYRDDDQSRDHYTRHNLNIRPYPNEDERSDDKPRDYTRHNIDPHSYAPSYDVSDVTPRDYRDDVDVMPSYAAAGQHHGYRPQRNVRGVDNPADYSDRGDRRAREETGMNRRDHVSYDNRSFEPTSRSDVTPKLRHHDEPRPLGSPTHVTPTRPDVTARLRHDDVAPRSRYGDETRSYDAPSRSDVTARSRHDDVTPRSRYDDEARSYDTRDDVRPVAHRGKPWPGSVHASSGTDNLAFNQTSSEETEV